MFKYIFTGFCQSSWQLIKQAAKASWKPIFETFHERFCLVLSLFFIIFLVLSFFLVYFGQPNLATLDWAPGKMSTRISLANFGIIRTAPSRWSLAKKSQRRLEDPQGQYYLRQGVFACFFV